MLGFTSFRDTIFTSRPQVIFLKSRLHHPDLIILNVARLWAVEGMFMSFDCASSSFTSLATHLFQCEKFYRAIPTCKTAENTTTFYFPFRLLFEMLNFHVGLVISSTHLIILFCIAIYFFTKTFSFHLNTFLSLLPFFIRAVKEHFSVQVFYWFCGVK